MGNTDARFRDRLPLSPLTLDELVRLRNASAYVIASMLAEEGRAYTDDVAEFVLLRDATRLRLGLPVSGRSTGSTEVAPQE